MNCSLEVGPRIRSSAREQSHESEQHAHPGPSRPFGVGTFPVTGRGRGEWSTAHTDFGPFMVPAIHSGVRLVHHHCGDSASQDAESFARSL